MAAAPAIAGIVVTGVVGLLSVAKEVHKVVEKKKPVNRIKKWSERYETVLLTASRFQAIMNEEERRNYTEAYQ